MLPPRATWRSPTPTSVALTDVLRRICVRPPYFDLRELSLEGTRLRATCVAEAPTFGERGPIAAADLGRHAAIAGLAHAALEARDDARRYYLARQAECVYVRNDAPYGSPVVLRSELVELQKRNVRARVAAEAAGSPLATIVVDYAILTEGAFERLFRQRSRQTPPVPSPYGRLVAAEHQVGEGWAECTVADLPVGACAGHFEGYPAMPVAVLMGQLSYLAGRVASGDRTPYRVVRGLIDADDLVWAGETARFRAERVGDEDGAQRFTCGVTVDGRSVAAMELWLELVGEGEPRGGPGL